MGERIVKRLVSSRSASVSLRSSLGPFVIHLRILRFFPHVPFGAEHETDEG